METHYFWAFFIVALLVGAGITFAYTSYKSTVTGAAFWRVSQNPWIKATCKDTDGGIDYLTKGSVTHCIGYACELPKRDHCLTASMLREYYCKNGRTAYVDYACPNGCEGGACIGEGVTELRKCLTINQSGTYVLNSDIYTNTSGICFLIWSDGVTVDCQGHKIINTNPNAASEAFYVGKYMPNPRIRAVNIKNCYIKNFFEAIQVANAQDTKIENNILENDYHGVAVGSWMGDVIVEDINITNNTISNNTLPGVTGQGCPVTIYFTQKVKMSNDYICDSIYTPCFYGPPVFCDNNSTIIDGGGNRITSTNCPIDPGSCQRPGESLAPLAPRSLL